MDIAAKGPNPNEAVRAEFMPDLAEGMGFEPTIELPYNGFEDRFYEE